jgi:hypothetical protein
MNMPETRRHCWLMCGAARWNRILKQVPLILTLVGGLALPLGFAGDKKAVEAEERLAAEINGRVEKVYIILYTANGRQGLQYLTDKKAAALSPAETTDHLKTSSRFDH